jgi:hypothetical protein
LISGTGRLRSSFASSFRCSRSSADGTYPACCCINLSERAVMCGLGNTPHSSGSSIQAPRSPADVDSSGSRGKFPVVVREEDPSSTCLWGYRGVTVQNCGTRFDNHDVDVRSLAWLARHGLGKARLTPEEVHILSLVYW